MQSRRQESGDSLVLEISMSACETSPMERKPLIGILLLQFAFVFVFVFVFVFSSGEKQKEPETKL